MPGTPLEIEIDLTAVQQAAATVAARLDALCARYALSDYAYCRRLRIAPTEVPHSHPVLTLNTRVRDDLGLVRVFLHEQMHWYVCWFAQRFTSEWAGLQGALRQRYPDVPVGAPDGARDIGSTYLHLVINGLEFRAAERFFPRQAIIASAEADPIYRWIYRTVAADWDALTALYQAHGVLPIVPASAMSSADLALAAAGESG